MPDYYILLKQANKKAFTLRKVISKDKTKSYL